MRFSRLLLALLALALLAADATAGPLQRLRARRAGSCAGCGTPAAGATYAHAIPAAPAFQPAALTLGGGCPGGRCPVR